MAKKHEHPKPGDEHGESGATSPELRQLILDAKVQQRVLRFLNDARVPEQLMVAPHDRLAIDEETHHTSDHMAHFEHLEPKQALDSEAGRAAPRRASPRVPAQRLHEARRAHRHLAPSRRDPQEAAGQLRPGQLRPVGPALSHRGRRRDRARGVAAHLRGRLPRRRHEHAPVGSLRRDNAAVHAARWPDHGAHGQPPLRWPCVPVRRPSAHGWWRRLRPGRPDVEPSVEARPGGADLEAGRQHGDAALVPDSAHAGGRDRAHRQVRAIARRRRTRCGRPDDGGLLRGRRDVHDDRAERADDQDVHADVPRPLAPSRRRGVLHAHRLWKLQHGERGGAERSFLGTSPSRFRRVRATAPGPPSAR